MCSEYIGFTILMLAAPPKAALMRSKEEKDLEREKAPILLSLLFS
jgi:hypothetical protein